MTDRSKVVLGNANLSLNTGSTFLTEWQLAARHQKSPKTLRNLRVQGGYIKYYKLNRSVRYALADIEAYEAAHQHGGGEE